MIERKNSLSIAPKPRLFYGYIIVIASFCITVITFGARNAFGVFFKPMADNFGWSSAATSSAFSLSMFMEGLLGIVMGKFTDRFGPRAVLLFCGFLTGLGYLLVSQVNTLWQMYLCYGIIIGIGMSGVFVPLVATIARWFETRRSIMTGIVLTGVSVGTLIAAPMANWLIYAYDWRISYITLGGATLVIVMLAAAFLKRDPDRMGQMPDNKTLSPEQRVKPDTSGFSFKEAFHTRQFWIMNMVLFCFGFCRAAVTVHIVPDAIHLGMPASTGAMVLAILSGADILGRLALGTVADRMGTRKTAIIGFILLAGSLLWLIFARDIWSLYLFAVVFGFSQGGTGTAQGPMVAELFGLKSYGSIMGVCGFCATVGASIGPYLSGYLFDVTGGYQTAFILFLALSIIGLLSISLLTPVKRKNLQYQE